MRRRKVLRLRPIFTKLSWLFLEEVRPKVERDFIEFELAYYEEIFISEAIPKSPREAVDCIDLVVLHERDDRFYAYWPRLNELYRVCSNYLRENTALFEDPIFGQGRFTEDRIKARHEYKERILRGFAERKGYVIV
jgi:hypothetical protein